MKSIDFNKYKFKIRSLPNSKTFKRYLETYVYFFGIWFVYNFFYICLVSEGLTPTFPAPFVFAVPIVFVYVYTSLENEFKNVTRDTLKEVVVHIRLKQSQSLLETLEENPEILNETYNKKSLLYWAKHYNNLQANTIITGLLRKKK